MLVTSFKAAPYQGFFLHSVGDGGVLHKPRRGYHGTCPCTCYCHRPHAHLCQPTSTRTPPPSYGCHSSYSLVRAQARALLHHHHHHQ
ncbi:hypothetical protein V6Z12_D12G009200 [Gossypium hirsutum]|uniref:Uncharacterized protein n=1 Tax=Gossypium darwinii TaxID=34276 RepID=A0A5D2A386_GOSDA|nr:hypothetical protein ES288_D12G009700v1 [Gossypium darwinii]TYG39354.1 hypothetical protein ES288_D12G010000v1 [Gossypium darwinii]